MRDPIPVDRPRLLVLLQSQFALLGTAVRDPAKYIRELNKDGPAMIEDYTSWPIEELRALALSNARKILDLILTGQLSGGF